MTGDNWDSEQLPQMNAFPQLEQGATALPQMDVSPTWSFLVIKGRDLLWVGLVQYGLYNDTENVKLCRFVIKQYRLYSFHLCRTEIKIFKDQNSQNV